MIFIYCSRKYYSTVTESRVKVVRGWGRGGQDSMEGLQRGKG